MYKRKWVILPLVFILLTGFIKSDKDIYFQINRSIDIFGKVYKEVSMNYVDELNPQEFILAGIKGMLSSLDPYTIYIDENLQNDIDVITKGKYGGIGATIGLRNDKVTVIDLIEGYSAQRQGIRIGDIIKRINGTEISKENYNELSSFIKGEPGTEVTIVIDRDGIEDEIIFNLVREEVEIKNLTYYGFVPANSSNVYLKLSGFTRTAGNEIKTALMELKSKKPFNSIVLDLRGNPGGLLDAAIDVCEKFLTKNDLVVSVVNRDSSAVKHFYSKEEPVAGNSKLIVLVDNGSASASEIVAGAIQDHDRGIILGTRSFGKGLVQTLIPLSFNTSLKITTARYYTPSGRSIQKIDYSKKNKVFKNLSIIDNSVYKTDHERDVRGAGGIKPDTIVSNEYECKQFGNLIARGMFFKFATYSYNTTNQLSVDSISDDKLFMEFSNYLKKKNFEYISKSEKLLTQLKNFAVQQNYNEDYQAKVEALIEETKRIKEKELDKNKIFVVDEIKKELAARIAGRNGRIRESLKSDHQFEVAFNILQNDSVYNKILNLSE